jgi:lipoate-protein ligase B
MAPERILPIPVHRWGQEVSYAEACARQEELVDRGEEAIIFCEHPPTITLGSAATAQDLTLAPIYYERMGVTVHRSPRGGKATYHGPGQIVAYPILNLRQRNITLHGWLRMLETLMLRLCSFHGIPAHTVEGKTGVWVENRKLGFIGVRVRKGCCYHGCSINVLPQAQAFRMIVPCGMPDLIVTSIQEECAQTPTVWDAADILESYLFQELYAAPMRSRMA